MPCYHPRIQSGFATTSNFCKDDFYFTSCNHLVSYRGISDSMCLCCDCYNKIRTSLIRAQFKIVKSHFITIGLDYLMKYCANCENQVVYQRPLKQCNSCINKLSQFKFNLEEKARTFEDYETPIVLLIKGRYY